jgi:hypothetical protein
MPDILQIISFILPLNLDRFFDSREKDAASGKAFFSSRINWLRPEPILSQKVFPNWSMYAIGWIPATLMLLYSIKNGLIKNDWILTTVLYFYLFPVIFTFFCNIYRVRRFRELEWIWTFLLMNIITNQIAVSPQYFFIIPVSILHLAFICWRASRDPQVSLLSAGIEIRKNNLERALEYANRAKSLNEGKLAIAEIYRRLGRTENSVKICKKILDTELKKEQAFEIFPELSGVKPQLESSKSEKDHAAM